MSMRFGLHKWKRTILIFLMLPMILLARSTEKLQREFVEWRFGAFVHFGIMTFTGAPWATPNQNVQAFNPEALDCRQWATAFKEAGMKFAILTTKHHDGFCLWDSKFTTNDVASTPWKQGRGDVLKEFVDACRESEIKPCFYYSIWDNTVGIGNGPITEDQLQIIKGQLKEILIGYGPISLLFIDGWSWKMGHKKVRYDEIRALVKKLQPNCLLIDNTHLPCLYHNDLIHYESGNPCPKDNSQPAMLSLLINKTGGNDWFWAPGVSEAELLSVKEVIDTLSYLEKRWCNLVLNCPPNRDGLLDKHIVQRLRAIGLQWEPDSNRGALPQQDPFMEYPIIPDTAWASSGDASLAIDGFNDRFFYSVWQTSKPLPQYLIIDLGKIFSNVGIIQYVPNYVPKLTPLKEGSIREYRIYAGISLSHMKAVAAGEWTSDTHMKTVTFPPTKARYVKLIVLSAEGGFAAATEIAIGRIR